MTCLVCQKDTGEHSIAELSACLRSLTSVKLETSEGEMQRCAFCSRETTQRVGGRPHCGRIHGRRAPLKFTPRPFEGRRG